MRFAGRGCKIAFLRPRESAGFHIDANEILRRPNTVEVLSNHDRARKINRSSFVGPDGGRCLSAARLGHAYADQSKLMRGNRHKVSGDYWRRDMAPEGGLEWHPPEQLPVAHVEPNQTLDRKRDHLLA